MNIEKHLFDDINFFPNKMKILILGTFPVPLYSNIEKFEKLSKEEQNNAWYYSSKRSEFWKIIADCFNIDYKSSDDFLFNNMSAEIRQRIIDNFRNWSDYFGHFNHQIRIIDTAFREQHNVDLRNGKESFRMFTKHHDCTIFYQSVLCRTCQ